MYYAPGFESKSNLLECFDVVGSPAMRRDASGCVGDAEELCLIVLGLDLGCEDVEKDLDILFGGPRVGIVQSDGVIESWQLKP